MRLRRHFELILATLLLLVVGVASSLAQTSETNVSYPPSTPGQTNTDPPGRVARIQYMTGEVSIQPGGVNDWIAASLNRPLTTSDRVWTDKNSKAELNVGGGYIRLNSESSVTLTNVSDNTVQVELDQGVVELTVNYLGGGQVYELDTPNLAFTVTKPGVYRFNVYPNEDQTWITVRKGQGEATGRGSAVKVKSGEQVRFSGGTSLAHSSEPAPAPDGFDDWASVRDQRLDNSVSARYVSPGVVGYQDLDAYGSWQTVAPYGPVWVPYSVPVGWAPYRFGRWTWIAPWGWTWVDNAAWGFAPFHYGRWVYTSGYWGWAPGPYRYWRACYAPALVGWVGGAGWGVGFGFAGAGWGVGINFGWFPLGWGEPYYPWYRGWHGHGLSPAYVRNVNVTNTHINNTTFITRNYYNNSFNGTHYANRNVNGAVTAASASTIASGQPVNRFGTTVQRSQLMHAPMARGIDATPTRDAMLGGQTPRSGAVPSSSSFQRSVVTRATPPQAATEARLNASRSVATPSPNTSTMRDPNAASNMRGGSSSFVARPPVANGTPAVNNSSAPVHGVPRPPVANGNSYGHGGTYSAATPYGSSNAARPADAQRSLRPTSPSVAENTSSERGNPEGRGGTATRAMASGVPRPPSNYTYRAAPAYSAPARGYLSNSYAGTASNGRSNSYAGERSHSAAPTYTPRASYGANAGSESSAAHVSGHSAAPNFGVQHAVPAVPHYSAPMRTYSGGAAAHYSAPGAGGAAHYSAPSGGAAASHASHGSGGGRTR